MYLIPILRAHNRHIGHHKIFVENLKSSRSTAAPTGHHSSSRFSRHLAPARIKQTVKKHGHLPGNTRKVNRRSYDHAVDFIQLGDDLVDLIVYKAASRLPT